MSLRSLLGKVLKISAVFLLAFVLLGSSTLPPGDQTEQARAFTRDIEFDYVGWIINALGLKIEQAALGTERFLTPQQRHDTVIQYLQLVQRIQELQGQLESIFSDPNIQDPQSASEELRAEINRLQIQQKNIEPLSEAILQNQIAQVVADFGLTLGGQPIPPVLYHSTPLPLALIISPRDVIRQDADISLVPDVRVEERAQLEEQVDQALDVSTLVVNIGGVGVYPTMVYQTSDLDWLSEVVAHEWVHNFLTLRPLGMSYLSSPELRIMNETAASIAGKEIGRAVLERYYPELVPPPPPPTPPAGPTQEQQPEQPVFNYYAEMRETRVTVDELLEEGKIEEAEQYMEQRRVFFWEHGYRHLRKLNQAYFAFHGAYADQPGGGAAGEDPVGAAVRALRAQSPTLEDFLERISWMWSFEQLQRAVK